MMKVTLILLVALMATASGCAKSKSPSASTSSSASVATPANVTGTWTGSTTTGARVMTLQLKQTGKDVTGTLAGAGVLDGPIEGTVDGNTIRLRERSGFGSTPSLNVRGDQITGDLGGTTLNLRRMQ